MKTGVERARQNRRLAKNVGCLLLLVLLAGLQAGALHAEARVYTLAVVPQHPPLIIHRNWRPLLKRLQQDTGLQFRLKTYNDFRQFLAALHRGEPDFSYLAPDHLVLAHRSQGYQPLLRDDSRQLVGLLLVRQDSPLKSVHELDGKTIAFPSPNAFAASLYMRHWLRKTVGIDFTPRYVGTHDNVYRHIVRGKVHAGSGVNTTLSSQPEALKQRLRILYDVPGVVAHPLAVHPQVPEEIQKQVQAAMLKLKNTAAGRQLLNAVQVAEPVAADYQRDYAHLENMGFEE